MTARLGAAAAFSLVAASIGAQQLQFPPAPPPRFSATIEYVEVDARVLDQQRRPVRDLTQQDFTILEDGAPQDVSVFSVVDIPVPSAPAASAAAAANTAGVKPDVETNNPRPTDGRIYLVVVDDLSIQPKRTAFVRRFLREFINRSVGPSDLVGFSNTGRSATYAGFTNDKARLLAAVDTIVGESPGSPTVQSANALATRAALMAGGANGENTPVAGGETFDVRNTQRALVGFIQGMAGAVDGRSKAIILIGEGTPVDTVTNTEGQSVIGDLDRVTMLARRSNVPIYPVDPRGLSAGFDDVIDVGIVGLDQQPEVGVKNEVSLSQQRLRVLADDTGGIAIVNANDLAGGLDRIVSQSSFYYALGYYAKNPRRDGKFHRISVKINRPGLTVLARHGYTASSDKAKRASVDGPPGSSQQLRETLNSALPVSGLPMATTAAAFRQANGRGVSALVIVEGTGAELAWTRSDALAAPLELAAVALAKRGEMRSGDAGKMQLPRRTDTSDRVRQFGFRWLARLDDLKPGRYQIRAVARNGPSNQGSVWYDLDIPDFSKGPLTMSDVLLESEVAMQRLTIRPDALLAAALPGPPTTLREFFAIDTVAVYAEVYDNLTDTPHDVETVVTVTNEKGEAVFQSPEKRRSQEAIATKGVYGVRARVSMEKLPPGRYVLAVEARQTQNRAISAGRAVPFQVVAGGNR